MPVLYGVFLFMGVSSLKGIQVIYYFCVLLINSSTAQFSSVFIVHCLTWVLMNTKWMMFLLVSDTVLCNLCRYVQFFV